MLNKEKDTILRLDIERQADLQIYNSQIQKYGGKHQF